MSALHDETTDQMQLVRMSVITGDISRPLESWCKWSTLLWPGCKEVRLFKPLSSFIVNVLTSDVVLTRGFCWHFATRWWQADLHGPWERPGYISRSKWLPVWDLSQDAKAGCSELGCFMPSHQSLCKLIFWSRYVNYNGPWTHLFLSASLHFE